MQTLTTGTSKIYRHSANRRPQCHVRTICKGNSAGGRGARHDVVVALPPFVVHARDAVDAPQRATALGMCGQASSARVPTRLAVHSDTAGGKGRVLPGKVVPWAAENLRTSHVDSVHKVRLAVLHFPIASQNPHGPLQPCSDRTTNLIQGKGSQVLKLERHLLQAGTRVARVSDRQSNTTMASTTTGWPSRSRDAYTLASAVAKPCH